jgi:hypothetical protein
MTYDRSTNAVRTTKGFWHLLCCSVSLSEFQPVLRGQHFPSGFAEKASPVFPFGLTTFSCDQVLTGTGVGTGTGLDHWLVGSETSGADPADP